MADETNDEFKKHDPVYLNQSAKQPGQNTKNVIKKRFRVDAGKRTNDGFKIIYEQTRTMQNLDDAKPRRCKPRR